MVALQHSNMSNHHHHYLLFKPYGVVSQFICEDRRKKVLGELYPFAPGTMAVGRLDEDSEGLLLLTTDGRLSDRIRKKDTEKEYWVQVDGEITDTALQLLEAGVRISIKGVSYDTLPCKVCRLNEIPILPPRGRKIRDDRHGPTSWIAVVITEGKLRQVRKMTAAVGFPTLRLVRVRIGEVRLGHLQPGEVHEYDFSRAFPPIG